MCDCNRLMLIVEVLVHGCLRGEHSLANRATDLHLFQKKETKQERRK